MNINDVSPDVAALNPELFGKTERVKTAVTPTPKQRSPLEIRLAMILDRLSQELDIPPFEQEHRFHPSRRWRFDFALPETKVAIEAEGGTRQTTGYGYSKGHAHPDRFESDCEKYNTATAAGWQVYRFTGAMIKDGRAEAFLRSIFPPF